MCSLNFIPGPALATIDASVALRTSSGSRRRSSPFNSIRSKANRNVLSSWRRQRMRLNEPTPLSSPASASPSMTPDLKRRPANLDHHRQTTSNVVARTTGEAHLRAGLADDDAEAIVLGLVQPLAAGRQIVGLCRKARRDEPGRQGTLQHIGINIKSRNVCWN